MKLIKSTFFILCFFCSSHSAFCEDTLIFLNGKIATGSVIDTLENIKYLDVKTKKNNKVRNIDKDRVFSIKYSSGQNVIFYRPDTTGENDLTIEEMQYFIYGEQDALKYKAPIATVGGVIVGAVAGPFVPGTAGLAFLVPGLYSVLTGSRWIKIKKETVRDQELLKEKAYLVGYERTARNRRVQNALKGSGIGLLLGIGAAVLITNLD